MNHENDEFRKLHSKYYTLRNGRIYEDIPGLGLGCKNEEYDCNKEDLYDEYAYIDRIKKRTYEVDTILGMGSGEVLVEAHMPLCPPAAEVLSCFSSENVTFDKLSPEKGKVVINGTLIRCIPYRPICRPLCTSYSCYSSSVISNTQNAVIKIPFIICINIPEVVKGAKIVILGYDVVSINTPYCSCHMRPIKSITEKDYISVKVKVVKPAAIALPYLHPENYHNNL